MNEQYQYCLPCGATHIKGYQHEQEGKLSRAIKISLFIIIWGFVLWQIASLATKGTY